MKKIEETVLQKPDYIREHAIITFPYISTMKPRKIIKISRKFINEINDISKINNGNRIAPIKALYRQLQYNRSACITEIHLKSFILLIANGTFTSTTKKSKEKIILIIGDSNIKRLS